MSKSILALTVSLVDRHKLDIDPYAGITTDISFRGWPARPAPIRMRQVLVGPVHVTHYYSGMPPGLSLVAVPYYVLAKTWLWLVVTPEREKSVHDSYVRAVINPRRMPVEIVEEARRTERGEKHLTVILLNLFICIFGCSVMAGAMAAMFHRALTLLYPDLEERRRLVTTWLFSFGTLWFIYSPAIYHRVFSTFLCFSAFTLALPHSSFNVQHSAFSLQRSALILRALLFGALLGLAIATSYDMAIVAAALLIYAGWQWGKLWPWRWTAVGLLFFLILVAAYHTACFGAPWITPYATRVEGSVAPPLFRSSLFALRPLPSAFRRLFEFLFGSRYGFFFYSPLLLLAFPAVSLLLRARGNSSFIIHHSSLPQVAALAYAIFASLMAFHFVSGYDGLPGEFGFRMMKPAIPFLMLLAPLSYRWSYRYVVPVLAGLSAVILAKGVMFGIHAGRPFWSNYLELISRYGFANYTLANIKDHVMPDLSPWVISAIHLGALALVGLFLWRFVWRATADERQPQTNADDPY
ncbi:hypothetical protein FJY63_03295 [Candidatus Sumerlaeota bacterium]|nr:hypothetical protein [Candidatus Sumerlaeota bacterium]